MQINTSRNKVLEANGRMLKVSRGEGVNEGMIECTQNPRPWKWREWTILYITNRQMRTRLKQETLSGRKEGGNIRWDGNRGFGWACNNGRRAAAVGVGTLNLIYVLWTQSWGLVGRQPCWISYSNLCLG